MPAEPSMPKRKANKTVPEFISDQIPAFFCYRKGSIFMKKLTKIMCMVLSLIMVISVFSINASAASNPKLSKSSMTMLVGGEKTLKVTGTSKTVTWSSTNKSVCTVTKQGKVKAAGTGTAKICATVGNKKLYCKVTVVKSYISSVSAKTINQGERKTFSLKSYNVKAVNAYSTNNKAVKVVSSSVSGGKVKITVDAVSGGTAYINITDKNNKSASASVKITVKKSGSSTAADNSDTSSSNYAEQVLELVNKERADAGVPALSLDDKLCEAAQVRAKEVGESFSHARPDGSSCFTVFDSYGISFSGAGENIAYGSTTSKGVMNQWMNSPGHRANILKKDYKKIGVGYDPSTQSWVQLFIY